MSATLSSAGLARVGFPAPEVVRVASPFDYHRQALLYVPMEALEPKHPRYQEYVVQECLRLIEVSQGRALILFTSWKLLDQTYEHMAPILDSWGFKPLKQGDLPREQLVQAFRADESSCLMGLASLWEGVDVPGSSCSLVILTRLPFSVPTEPLAVARAEKVRARGGDPFAVLSLPDAVLRFKQGFGRLIRTAADRGVVACLDARFLSSRYGHEFRRAVREVPGTRSPRKVHLLLNADQQRAEAG